MRVSLLLVVLAALSLLALVAGVPEQATHVDAMEQHELEHDIQQPARPTPTPTTPSTRTTPRTPATPTRPRTGIRPRTPRTGLMFGRDPFRFGMDPGMGLTRLTRFERRMLRRMFREMLRLRMREMFGFPMSRWEMRMIRMMALRDMMMSMDIQTQDAQELATIVDQREADMDETEDTETYDDTTETETATEMETEAEPETESEHDTEAIPEETVAEPELEEDATLIESEFDISAPSGGGYGGFGFGGYGGYGSKKGYGYGGYGGYGKKAPYKKVPYKKVPYKKVPYKKTPYKKGYGGYGYGGY